jgi:hypothetical protein
MNEIATTAPATFTIGFNHKVVGKTAPYALSDPGDWQPTSATFADLANHIGKGHPWMPALLDGNQKRWQINSNYAEVIALDIDNQVKEKDGKIYRHEMLIAEAIKHPYIAAYCALGIPSASHSDNWNKFRLVFRLPRPVKDWETLRICNRYLAHVIGSADPACKDASRFFFGAPGRKPFLLNEAATLPANFIDEAMAWHQALEAAERRRAEQAQRQWLEYQAKNPGVDTDGLVRSALAAISPDCDYNDWIGIGMALAGMGDHWLQDWDGWSAGAATYKPGECERKWKSFRGKRHAPEVIFGIAKRYGWQFPKKSWLAQIGDRLNRKPSPQKSAEALKKTLKDKPFTGNEYEPGHRVATWQRAFSEGYRYVLDQSGTGAGKSHDTGQLQPEDFAVRQLMYFSGSHYNPTTATLKEWSDLHGRHNGLTREDTASVSRLRRAKRGEERVSPANCSRNGIIQALRAKNIPGADSAELVCGTCPIKDACTHSQGYGFGFLNQRRLALAADRLRLHPDSAPGSDYAYKNVLAIWDEPSDNFTVTKTVTITVDDVDRTIGHLATTAPELWEQLRPFLTAVKGLFSLKQQRYGLNHSSIVESLPPLPEGIDIQAIKDALKPELSFLDPVIDAESGLRVSDLPGRSHSVRRKDGDVSRINLRSHFSEDEAEQRDKAESTVLKQWLVDLVNVITTGAGALHLSFENLTITQLDARHREIAQATKGNIFLDATLSREDLAMMLGCSPEDIYLCRQRPEQGGSNLTITQVNDLGRVSMQRGKDQRRRIEALVNHYREVNPNTRVIDFKKFDADGAWWRDSRGVNAFTNVTTLMLVGTPCRNLAALQAEYACLKGQFPGGNNEEFRQWTNRKIRADMLQGIGRLRAQRRPGECLHVVVLSNFDLGVPAEQVAAREITLKAATKVERMEAAITAAVKQLQAQGQKVTQAAVALIVGCSQGYISRFRYLLQTLLDPPNSKSNNFPNGETISLVWDAIDLCSTIGDLDETVIDLVSGLENPFDLLLSLVQLPPPD